MTKPVDASANARPLYRRVETLVNPECVTLEMELLYADLTGIGGPDGLITKLS